METQSVDREYADLVQPESGMVSSTIFTDPGIYQLELEKIFTKSWLYLGHESQLPNENDFFTTYMGSDSVVVTRSGGKIRAFLNFCTHRGMKVCRTDSGNAPAFTCPYHGWCFSSKGELVGVPGYREAYYENLEMNRWGLREVAQLDTFGGLIFATWNPNASSLLDYLGEMAVYLDRVVSRSDGGVEMIGGVQKWELPVNWKMPAENFLGDSYHVATTHGSVMDIGYRKRPKKDGFQISLRGGHGFGSELGGFGAGSTGSSAYAKYIDEMRAKLDAQDNPANQFIPLGHSTIFPNMSILDSVKFRMIRMSHPRGPRLTESHTMCFVDKNLDPELKEEIRREFILSFGPSGMFEVEDGEIWGEIADSISGYMASRQSFNYQMGLGKEELTADKFGQGLPGRTGWYWSEINQREYYRQWRSLMEAK